MSKDILKKAAADAMEKELSYIPSEKELSGQYTFSESFLQKMESLFRYVNRTYMDIRGILLKREHILVFLLAAFNLAVLAVSSATGIKWRDIRFICSIGTLIILSFFAPRKDKDGSSRQQEEDFGGSYMRRHAPAMIDTSGVDPSPYPYRRYPRKELEYIIPTVPQDYSVEKDIRSASTHIVEFRDIAGRSLTYEKRLLKDAVLVTVDPYAVKAEEFILNGCDAICFEKDGETHILWEDKYHQLYLHSADSKDTLMQTAENIPVEFV